MKKDCLPVILLKGLCMLPFQEAKLELNNEISKKVIDVSEKHYDKYVLIVSPINTLEENPDVSDLPNIGVVGKVKSKIVLSNGLTRVIIEGVRRVKVNNYRYYSKDKNVLESQIKEIKTKKIDPLESKAFTRKLTNLLKNYIEHNHNISNSIISAIKGIDNLNDLTDKIANFMNFSFDKKIKLMLETNEVKRSEFLINELNIELKLAKIDEKIEETLQIKMDESQKDYILREKIKIIQNELGDDNFKNDDILRYNSLLENSLLPKAIKEKVSKEIRRYEITPEASQELIMIRSYIDTLLSIPWGLYTEDETNLSKINASLNKSHYGLNDVKERIIEYIAVKKRSDNSPSPIICLVGPPGTGKTTFAESIAESLNRNFVKISLGGLSDSTELIGHRRTYIGSSPGKIIMSIIKSGSMNPIILLDEVDKLYKDFRGDPAATLLDILDKNQNQYFMDNYIEESVDLSKVFFVLTANDKASIPVALLDRLEIINISGYTDLEKFDIAKKYLLKRSLNACGLDESNIKMDSPSINKLIRCYTRESGVRELDRVINKLIRKIVTKYELENKELDRVSIKEVDVKSYLGSEIYSKFYDIHKNSVGMTRAMAYTSYGGTIIDVEVIMYPGNGKVIYTGSLGKVINESADISLSYIKSNKDLFDIDVNKLIENDIHVNFREAGVPKDGTSAGTVITTALLSLLKEEKIKKSISMTGEITLNGDVLAVGGLKEKCLAALRYNVKTVFVPESNRSDIDKLDEDIKKGLEIITVKNYEEIYNYLFK